MATYTPKLNLLKPVNTDPLNACRDNWDRLDTAFSRVLWVLPDIIPSAALLFDGCLVGEIGNGKFWRAQRNPSTGDFDRKWVKYPWLMFASTPSIAVASGGIEVGLTTATVARCVNSGQDDIVSNQIVAPETGLYAGILHVDWTASASAGNRLTQLYVNGVADATYRYVGNPAVAFLSNRCLQTLKWSRNLNKGDKVSSWLVQSSGSNITAGVWMQIALLRVI